MTSKLYNVMYHIIDTCYAQNLGLEESLEDSEIFSLVLKAGRQLDEWKWYLLPRLRLRVCTIPLTPQDLDRMEAKNKIFERFNLVLSLRYHNLRILLHRPVLEKILDSTNTNTYTYTNMNSNSNNSGIPPLSGSGRGMEPNMLQQIGITSVQTCVDSAMIIISIVHTIVLQKGWRRDLLGAWNYSLFYSK